MLFVCAEVKLVLESLPHNFLKLVSGEGLSDVIPNLTKFLKPGKLFEAVVLKSFPEKNTAIFKVEKENEEKVIEADQQIKNEVESTKDKTE